jgi:hypothetical protein
MSIVIDKWGSDQPPDDSGGGIVIDKWGDDSQSMSGIGKAAAGGLGRGTAGMLGLPGEIGSLASVATSKVGSMLGIEPGTVDQFKEQFSQNARYNPLLRPFTQPGSAEVQKNIMEPVTGEFYEPQTTTEKYVSTAAEFLPGTLALPGGGSLARRAITGVTAGLGSEAAGQYFKDSQYEPYARFGGAVAGSAVPGMLARGLNPSLNVSPERRAMADVLRREGVTPTAGQLTGSPTLKAFEHPYGFNQEKQLEDLTKAAMTRTGEPAVRATRANVAKMMHGIGKEFEDLGTRNRITVGPQQLLSDVKTHVDEYKNLIEAPNRAPIIENTAKEIANHIQNKNGVIPGNVYQVLQSKIAKAARKTSSPEASEALRGMKDALDDAMERSIAATNPRDLGAWQEVRTKYRNALVIQQAASSGGENVAQGLLTPGKLSQAVTNVQGKSNRARGKGDFSELADAADTLLTSMPNSGTPVRNVAGALVPGIITGAVSGTASGLNPVAALAGFAAGAAGQHAVMNNPLTQAYLSGRLPLQGLVNNPSSTASRDAALQALLRLNMEPSPLRITVNPSDAR